MDKAVSYKVTAKIIVFGALAIILAGCATSPVPLGLPCSVGPIYGDKGAATRWTRGEKEQIVALNRTGEILCKWKPPS